MFAKMPLVQLPCVIMMQWYHLKPCFQVAAVILGQNGVFTFHRRRRRGVKPVIAPSVARIGAIV